MVEKIDLAKLYGRSIPPGQKSELLTSYCDYVSFVSNFEYIVKKYTPKRLAALELIRLYDGSVLNKPWDTIEVNDHDKRMYQNFVSRSEAPEEDKNLCFVTIDHTTPCYLQNEDDNLISIPHTYRTRTVYTSLPNNIERYTIAYPKDEKLKDAHFLVNGKFMLKYCKETEDMSVAEAVADPRVSKQFTIMLNALSNVNKEQSQITDADFVKAQVEALASSAILPLENIMLYTLGGLAETENNMMKNVFQARCHSHYMDQAENTGFVNNAANFQDYLNLRNLMHHQWDTLDSIGRFNTREKEKNISVRQRFLESYRRICDKSLVSRLETYKHIAEDLGLMAQKLNPNLFTREPNESNSKFVARIKTYAKAHPEQEIIAEMNYKITDKAKKEALGKNLRKVFPKIRVIDDVNIGIDEFLHKIGQYFCCQQYLDSFAQVEYTISEHCLFKGKNYHASNAWEYVRQQKTLSPEESEKWRNYREIRHQLSHNHLSEELLNKVDKLLPTFLDDADKLAQKLDSLRPELVYVKDNTYCAKHPDGKEVFINFSTKEILRITEKNGFSHGLYEYKNIKDKIYKESNKNGVEYVLHGNKINELITPQKMTCNLKHNTIVFPDDSKLYMGHPKFNYLTVKGKTKLVMDKNFKILNYIVDGKSVTLEKNETLRLNGSNHKIKIDSNGCLSSQVITDKENKEIRLSFSNQNNKSVIKINDGTRIIVNGEDTEVKHNNIKLTYADRKKYAESYNSTHPSRQNNKGR